MMYEKPSGPWVIAVIAIGTLAEEKSNTSITVTSFSRNILLSAGAIWFLSAATSAAGVPPASAMFKLSVAAIRSFRARSGSLARRLVVGLSASSTARRASFIAMRADAASSRFGFA